MSNLVILLSRRRIYLPRYKHPPKPPNPPKKPQTFSFNGFIWEDDYAWMSNLNDKVTMRHMDMVMEQEENYLEAVMWGTEKLQAKLQSEMAPWLSFDLSTPPVKLGCIIAESRKGSSIRCFAGNWLAFTSSLYQIRILQHWEKDRAEARRL